MAKIQFDESSSIHWLKVLGDRPVFLFPARIVGGHELMALEIIRSITSLGADVKCLIEPSNTKLLSLLNNTQLPRSNIILLPFNQPRFEFLHSVLNYHLIKKAAEFLSEINKVPHTEILFVQGDIEIGSTYVAAAIKANVFFMSYLPFTHSAKVMGKKLAILRDYRNASLYKKVKRFATISTIFKEQLYQLSPGCNVELIRNNTRDLHEFKLARKEKGATPNCDFFSIFIIGRISYRQKGHDILLNAISKLDLRFRDVVELNIIGDGEDAEDFRHRCKMLTPWLRTRFLGWQSEPWKDAHNADLLVIPSRFEGVPLVMLEALELGIPILSSNKDGMIEYLNKDDLFDNEQELSTKIESILTVRVGSKI